MATEKIVVHFNNGRVKKGTTDNFDDLRNTFRMITLEGKHEVIYISELKSVFFVKDFEGNKHFTYDYRDKFSSTGKKVKIEYHDGEIIIGSAINYSSLREGFTLIPADPDGNNFRIFVVKAAVKHVQFLEPDKFKLQQ